MHSLMVRTLSWHFDMTPQTDASIGLAVALAAAIGAATLPLNDVTVAFIGVPLTAITMAALGAAMSYAFDAGERNRKRLFAITVASTLFGAACVTVVPEIFNWELSKVTQGPLAFIFALFARWMIPALRGALPAMAQAIASIFNRGSNYQPPYDSGGSPPNERDDDLPPRGGY